MRVATGLLGLFLVLTAGCPLGGGDRCDPGESVACACLGGATGEQRCAENGTWARCACPGAEDGGVPADGGVEPADGGPARDAGFTDAGTGDAGAGDAGAPCSFDVQCPPGEICESGRCVGGCRSALDCGSGLVCRDAACAPCTDTAQCPEGELCGGDGRCVEDQGCTDSACKSTLGAAYSCDPAAGQCVRGCTAEGCDVGDGANCNPCDPPATCDAATGTCSGQTCDCAALGCEVLGQVCDLALCGCTTPTGDGTGQVGDTCVSEADCLPELGCQSALPGMGLPGTCGAVCSQLTLCTCPPGAGECDVMFCMLGLEGACK